MSFVCPCGRKYKIAPEEPASNKPTVTMESVKALLTTELVDLLIFEDYPEVVVVRPKYYLPPTTFAKVAELLKQVSGEYVRAGKESHFKIKK